MSEELLKRPIAKFITANNIAAAVVYRLARIVMNGEEPTEEAIKGLAETHVSIAEFVVKQLDAYDQRS